MKKAFSGIIVIFVLTFLMSCMRLPSNNTTKEPSDIFTNSNNSEAIASAVVSEQNSENTSDSNYVNKTEFITETVLVDESGIKITTKSLDRNGLFGADLKLLIENNSGTNLTFQCRNSSVNGYMVNTLMSVDVINGKKATDTLTFASTDMEACNITNIADMEFSFHIFTSEGWDTFLDTPQIQLKTNLADSFEYSFDSSGSIAYEENNIKIVVKELSDDSMFGPDIVVYIENLSDKNITVQTRDVSVDGFMVDTIFSSDVMIGKRAVTGITISSSDLEENGITDISSVELSFHIFESDGWDTIVDTPPITIVF